MSIIFGTMPWMTVRSIMIKFSRIIYVKLALAKKEQKYTFHNTYWQICTCDNAIIESKNKYMGTVFSVVVFYFTDNEIDPFEKPI